MKINKIILSGVILILFGGLLFTTDMFTPFIRPITYIFLMGSSKGKDILFFILFGFLLIVSQLVKFKINTKKFLLIFISMSGLIFASAIILELYLRLILGIDFNTIFVTIKPSISTTSILHTHLIKSVLGEFLVNTINPFIGNGINTATSLYSYVSPFTPIIIVLISILFISMILAIQKRPPLITILLCFFSTILFIGCFDGGIMGTPGALGLFGCCLIYFNENNILNAVKHIKDKNFIKYARKSTPNKIGIKYLLKRGCPYFIGLAIIILRISVSLIGASPEYYEVDIYNPDNGLNLSNEYPIDYVSVDGEKISYHIDSSLNEMKLTKELAKSLNHSCDYYTLSWNVYSY